MDAIVAAAFNEISARGAQGCLLQNLWSGLRGAQGCLLQNLWSGLHSAIASAGLHFCDGVKQAIWQALLKVPGLSFGAPESSMDSSIPIVHPSIQSVEDAEILLINVVAPEHLRDSCVGLYDLKFSDAVLRCRSFCRSTHGLYDLKFSDAGLSADQCIALESLAKASSHGFFKQKNVMNGSLLQNIDCKAACGGRCKAASLHDRCLRACGTCCAKCNCVPPGTFGNKDLCPCYADMKTHGNKLKCP